MKKPKRRKRRKNATLRIHPDPILNQKCKKVKKGEDISSIVYDIMNILVNSDGGSGLAAPQAGHPKRVIAVGNYIMVNPVIIDSSDTKITQYEGCLSYPGKAIKVERSLLVEVEYEDERRVKRTEVFFKRKARIIQHEIDHLDGNCIFRDRKDKKK